MKWIQSDPKNAAAGASPAKTASPKSHSIRIRFLILVAVALSPIAVLSVAQGWERLKRDQHDANSILQKATSSTAEWERNVFLIANEKLRALAVTRGVEKGGSICERIMGQQLIAAPYLVNYIRIDSAGKILCSVSQRSGPRNLNDQAWWQDLPSAPDFIVASDASGDMSGQPVFLVVRPAYTSSHQFDGALLAVIDGHWIDDLIKTYDLPQTAVAAVVDHEGHVLLSNRPDAAYTIFHSGSAQFLGAGPDASFKDPKGKSWFAAATRLVRDDYYLGLAVPRAAIYKKTYIPVAVNLLLPILMILFASAAIWFGADRLIMRWLGDLRRTTEAYAHGHYAVRPKRLDNAPREFRSLIRAIYDMADAIQDRDKSQRDAVEFKTTLLKETHHRIKNSLQIVMSLLNLQASRLHDPAARTALDQARIRINALALVHRILHETEEQTYVEMNDLLTTLAAQLHSGLVGESRGLRLKVDVATMTLPTEIAIPLSLFATEAMINAYRHAFPFTRASGQVTVSLQPNETNQLFFQISDTGVGYEPAEVEEGTGTRLIAALAQQLGGTFCIVRNAQGGMTVTLLITDPKLQDSNDNSLAHAEPANEELLPAERAESPAPNFSATRKA